MLQLKIGASLAVLGVSAHALYVRSERAKAPTGRLLQFSPGSQDDIVADTLKTGDLVLFSRDCTLYPALAGLSCVARKRTSPYDQAGLILLVGGTPHVAEKTYSGVKVRRYDARVKMSRSKEVVVRRLAQSLDSSKEKQLVAFCQEQVAHNSASATELPEEIFMEIVKDSGYNPSLSFVESAYKNVGLPLPSKTKRPTVTMADVEPGKTAADRTTFNRDIWVRDLR